MIFIVDLETEARIDIMLAVDDTPGWPVEAEHFSRSVPLDNTVSIGPIHPSLQAAILDALEPRGENWDPPIRSFGAHYGLIRESAPVGSNRGICDADRKLSQIAAILRIARPHSMSLGHAARVITQVDGRRQICPALTKGVGATARVTRPDQRWIRDEDVAHTRQLLAALDAHKPPKRIEWAMLTHELVHWQHLQEPRWTLLCAALEGLVHTSDRADEGRNRDQFVTRMAKLREFVPALLWSEEDLDAIYDRRNQTMHGGDVRSLFAVDDFPPLYWKAETGFRAILSAAILDRNISDIFVTDAGVRVALGTMKR
jgi:hypothetical protein